MFSTMKRPRCRSKRACWARSVDFGGRFVGIELVSIPRMEEMLFCEERSSDRSFEICL